MCLWPPGTDPYTSHSQSNSSNHARQLHLEVPEQALEAVEPHQREVPQQVVQLAVSVYMYGVKGCVVV